MFILPILGIAVLAAAAATVINLAWFAPFAFGPRYHALVPAASQNAGSKAVLWGALLEALIAFGLIFTVGYSGVHPLIVAVFAWIVFFVPVELSATLYEKRPFKAALLTGGYRLLALLAMALVFILV